MNYLSNAIGFLAQVLVGAYIFILLLRVLMRATRVSPFHPIVTFIAKITNPACRLFHWFPKWRNIDTSAIVLAIVLEFAFYLLLASLKAIDQGPLSLLVLAIAEVLKTFLDMGFFLIIITVILSWVSPGYANPNLALFFQMTEPFLAPFRRFMPNLGGFDLTPLAALVVLQLAQMLLVAPLQDLAFRLG